MAGEGWVPPRWQVIAWMKVQADDLQDSIERFQAEREQVLEYMMTTEDEYYEEHLGALALQNLDHTILILDIQLRQLEEQLDILQHEEWVAEDGFQEHG